MEEVSSGGGTSTAADGRQLEDTTGGRGDTAADSPSLEGEGDPPNLLAWPPVDPTAPSADHVESTPWIDTFFPAMYDDVFAKLFGTGLFVDKLDAFFLPSSAAAADSRKDRANDLVSKTAGRLLGQLAFSNEPSHHIPYLYTALGVPSKTQRIVRTILAEAFSANPDGLDGNDDCGQLSSWYVLSACGLYPLNPASGQWWIGSPLFAECSIAVGGALGEERRAEVFNKSVGKGSARGADSVFRIVAHNVSDANMYVQRAALNGEPLDRLVLTHAEIVGNCRTRIGACGVLELWMDAEPQDRGWGIVQRRARSGEEL